MKTCSVCGLTKSLGDFYTIRDKPIPKCKTCARTHVKATQPDKNKKYKEARKVRGEKQNKGDCLAQHYRWRQSKFRWRKCGFEVVLDSPRQVPSWATEDSILSVYELAKKLRQETGESWVVDHIVPLRGELVSGLHCHENLQIISDTSNRDKKNLHV